MTERKPTKPRAPRPPATEQCLELEIVIALREWWDANGGDYGPHAGDQFKDTDQTWNDKLIDVLARARNRSNQP